MESKLNHLLSQVGMMLMKEQELRKLSLLMIRINQLQIQKCLLKQFQHILKFLPDLHYLQSLSLYQSNLKNILHLIIRKRQKTMHQDQTLQEAQKVF